MKKTVKKYQNSGPNLKASSDNTRVKKPVPSQIASKRKVFSTAYRNDGSKASQISVDTSGYSKGKESFPAKAQYWEGFGNKRTFTDSITVPRRRVDEMIKRPETRGVLKSGGKVPNGPLVKKKGAFKGSTLKKGGTVKKKK